MRRKTLKTFILGGTAALLFAALANVAVAQTGNDQYPGGPRTLDIQTMSFALWCLETKRYPAARCEERLAGDVAVFDAYRRVIERYEVQFLQQRERELTARKRGNIDPSQTLRGFQDSPLR